MKALERILDLLVDTIDIDHILNGIQELSAIERPTDSASFDAAAEYVRGRYAQAGLTGLPAHPSGIRHFPADGKTKFHTFTAPMGFRTRTAVCSQVNPDGSLTVLGDRAVEPNTAIVGTGFTGPAGVTAPVVLVQHASDISAATAGGKIVFTPNLHPMSLRNAAIAAGAKAVVSSYIERTDAHQYVRWHNTWDTQSDGWLPTAPAARQNFPGISLSPDVGAALATRLEAGPVNLRIVTEGEYFSGQFPAVDMRRDGADPHEIILSGHLFEQGAMDNASGVIMSILAAELLPHLCEPAGRTQRRGLRAFHSHECYGVLALSATDPAAMQQAIAHLNVDSVGAADVPLKVGRGLNVTAGATNRIFSELVYRASLRLRLPVDWWDRFSINCTILADPLLGGVPTSYIEQPHHSWHTSRDRFGIFQFKPEVLKQAALITAAWTGFMATADTTDAVDLLDLYHEYAAARLRGGVLDSELFFETTRREIQSAALLAQPADRAACLSAATARLDELARQAQPVRLEPDGTPAQVDAAKKLYPRTILGGPLAAEYFPDSVVKDLKLGKFNGTQYKLKCWAASGRLSVHDILRRTLFEEPPGTAKSCTLDYALRFFQALADAKMVVLGDAPSTA